MPEQTNVRMNDGKFIPALGIGVLRMAPDVTARVVVEAIEAGYRHVDTAAKYDNESGVGHGVREAGIAREDVFVTTKLWNDDQGYDAALAGFDENLRQLGLDHIDLYLIHWPCPERGLFVESWQALVRLREEGRARSIGVSNFLPEHLDRIVQATGVVPAVNQIEVHPYFQQIDLHEANRSLGIVTECWSPLGGGHVLGDPVIAAIAARLGRSPAQVILRWELDRGMVSIPKSVTPERIRQNIDVFDFELSDEDHASIAALDRADGRTGPDPIRFT